MGPVFSLPIGASVVDYVGTVEGVPIDAVAQHQQDASIVARSDIRAADIPADVVSALAAAMFRLTDAFFGMSMRAWYCEFHLPKKSRKWLHCNFDHESNSPYSSGIQSSMFENTTIIRLFDWLQPIRCPPCPTAQ